MAKYSVNITADGDYFICNITKNRHINEYRYGVNAYGTGGNNFGSGTLTFKISTDGGTTLVDLQDATGTAITLDANGNFTGNWGNGATNSDAPKMYVTMGSSTAPSVTVDYFDNNG